MLFGPGIIKQAKERGFKIFLDLKAHDIPNTVERAMAQVGRLGVAFVTVHAAGGSENDEGWFTRVEARCCRSA